MTSIVGMAPPAADLPGLLNISERYRSVLGWADQSFTCTTRFENLVGAQGGGSRKQQLQEIARILCHLGARPRTALVAKIAEQLFGGTYSFRQGQVGGWRTEWSTQHVSAFKDISGDLLMDLGYEKDTNWQL